MAHLEYVEKNVNAALVFDVVEDQSCMTVHCVECGTRCVSKFGEELCNLLSLLPQTDKIDVEIISFQVCIQRARAA